MTYTTNIIFLDFDGVLTSKSNGTYFCEDGREYTYSEEHLNRLLKLCDETDSKIVIASNWRRFEKNGVWKINDIRQYQNPLPKLYSRIGDYIVGEYPKDRHITKSEALMIWFEFNSIADGKSFAILDDDLREGYQHSEYSNKFVYIDNEHGLTDKDCNSVKKILYMEIEDDK